MTNGHLEKIRRLVCETYESGERFERLLTQASSSEPLPTAVVHPVDEVSLTGAIRAAERDLIKPILVGPEEKIKAVAKKAKLSLDPYEIVVTPHSHAAAAKSVELVHAGRVEALMKGALHTQELMEAVLDKTHGLRTERRMSHVYIMDVPAYAKPLMITDAAINIAPGLMEKRDIVQNAVDLARSLGIKTPKVAILSAIETVDPRIPSTIEAAALCKMADRGQIIHADLDGPLAFDNAISLEAAKAKGIKSSVAGQADILVVPDLETGNVMAKQLQYLAGAEMAGVVLGGRVPIILTSRADDEAARLASCAVAEIYASWQTGAPKKVKP